MWADRCGYQIENFPAVALFHGGSALHIQTSDLNFKDIMISYFILLSVLT